MEIDISLNGTNLSITVENPYRLDAAEVAESIRSFTGSHGLNTRQMDFEGLLPGMVRGVFGCEGGCPSDAKRLVARGFGEFKLSYIEGGILEANAEGDNLTIRVFPDF